MQVKLEGMTMLKKIGLLMMFVFLMVLPESRVMADDAPESPVPLYPGATIRTSSFKLYEHLALKLKPLQDGQGTLNVAGKYWHIWVECSEEYETIKNHYLELARKQGTVLADPGARGLHFSYNSTSGPVYVLLHAQSGKYSLKIIQPAALPSQVVFGDGNYAARNSDEDKALPNPPLLTDYQESYCIRFTYNDFNKLELQYTMGGKNISKTFEGRYWEKIVDMSDIDGRPADWISPADINETMAAAVVAAGGEVLSGENRELVFHVESAEYGNLWATLWPQDGRYTIKIIQEDIMKQVLLFDTDTMMARLDALGVLTLHGIFFDTAKATLITESEEALQAALKLMTDYPDLVIEVGGHTDNVGGAQDNEVLSQQRAASVQQWLLQAEIAPARLEAKGYGEAWPVADNSTDEGRAANRRVVLKKISGGKVRDIMTLIKPYPGSENDGSDEMRADYELLIYERNDAGRIQERTVTGTGFRQHYQVMNEAGKPDNSLSGIQIRHNYIQAVESFGGTILAEDSHGLYFRLDNLDGRITYVAVWAPGSGYHVTAVTVPAP